MLSQQLLLRCWCVVLEKSVVEMARLCPASTTKRASLLLWLFSYVCLARNRTEHLLDRIATLKEELAADEALLRQEVDLEAHLGRVSNETRIEFSNKVFNIGKITFFVIFVPFP